MSPRGLPNRRTFLRQVSAVSSSLFVPQIVSAAALQTPGPNDRIQVAFIGTGNNGTNWLRPFLNDDRVRVVAVCDVNREGPGYWNNSVRGRRPAVKMVNEFYKDTSCREYVDFREVLARDDIDAVYIGTPDHWHALIGVMAANAKKDIYGQKPLALTVAEGRAIALAVQQNKVVWQTGSQQRSDKNFRRACELVRNGRIGKLQTVRCGLPGGIPDFGKTAARTAPEPVPEGFEYDMWIGPAPAAYYCPARVGVNFRWILDYSGGQITDWGGHHPDIAQWGMGTERTGPIAIKNPKATFADGPVYNTATEYHFECVYENGVTLVISNTERGGVTFEGSEGWVWANRGRHDASSPEIKNSKIGPDETHLYVSDDHVRNFIDCMLSRREPVAPAEIAHRSITLAHLGNIAMRQGRELKWDPVKEQIIGDASSNQMLSRDYREPWARLWRQSLAAIPA